MIVSVSIDDTDNLRAIDSNRLLPRQSKTLTTLRNIVLVESVSMNITFDQESVIVSFRYRRAKRCLRDPPACYDAM